MNSFSCKVMGLLVVIACSRQIVAQNLAANEGLPESPGAVMQTIAPAHPSNDTQGTAQVQGEVLDTQGDPVPGATVIINAAGKLGGRTTTSGIDGAYVFSSLPAGLYRLIITAPGFAGHTTGEFAVKPAETVQAAKTTLTISSSTSVEVIATPDQVAVAQVHEQEKQRVLGVFPNFYTSYIWKAEPMPANQKFKLAFRAIGDPVTFLIVAGVAGAEQFNGTYPGYGPGIGGYGKRYAAAYGDALTSRIVGSAILPAVLHQDPRYFYQGSGTTRSRAWHAVSSTFVTRGDNGKLQPNYSHMLGSLAAGAVANAYHPESSRGLGLTFQTFGISQGANIVGNLVREFVLRGLVPSVPEYANGKK
jgi:hypothetical protein